MLVIASPPDAASLQRALESPGTTELRVSVAATPAAALDLLSAARFDAILFDLDLQDAATNDGIVRVRAMAESSALVAIGSDPNALQAAGPNADALIARDDAEGPIAACVRGALEGRRLREELQRRSSELIQSERRFRNIIERTADGIVILGEDRRVRFVNPAAERLFGRSATDLVGEDFGFAVVVNETTEIDIVRHDSGEPVVAELRVSQTTWDAEAAQLISLRDITDRKRAEERAHRLVLEQAAREQAERANRRSRFLAEASATLDSSLDPETTLVSLAKLIVPRVADWCVIDLDEGDWIQRVAGVHADPEKQPLLEELKQRFPPWRESPQPSARVLRSGKAELHRQLDGEGIRALATDDEHARLLIQLGVRSSMTVPLPARDHCLGTITFVCAERSYHEADLALAEEIASRAGRALENAQLYEAALAANRAKSDFLAVMSHELRTPLNAILGYTQLLLEMTPGKADDLQKKQLHRIRSNGTDLLQIIEKILTLAETEEGHAEVRPRTIQLGELIDKIVETAEPLAREKGLELRLNVDHRHATLVTDADKVHQIALNLLANAVKFTEQGTVALSVDLPGEDVVIAVSDTGIGFAPEDSERIFEPFTQAEQSLTRQAGGTGIGLSVSQRLAQLLGGTITAESQPGAGSTFRLRVPARMTTV